jgi:cytochrome c peroxidase
VFDTGLQPAGLAVAGGGLVVADHLGETVSFIDLTSGSRAELSLSRAPERYPANDFERGELVAETAVFSVDQDVSCVHCHYRDSSDGKKWSVSGVMGQSREHEERAGGSREVPDLRALTQKFPMNLGGTLSLDEALSPFMEQNPLPGFAGDQPPAGDFSGIVAAPGELAYYLTSAHARWNAAGKVWQHPTLRLVDLAKRRDVFMKRASKRWFGVEYDLRGIQRILGIWQGGEGRLLPSPEDRADPMIQRGKQLFESPEVGCAGCHPAPTFSDREHPHNQNKAFPPLISRGRRDAPHQTMGPDYIDHCEGFVRPWDRANDRGRVQEHPENMVAQSLRGLWARPPRFLHDGRAISLREVLATPGHPGLRPLPWPRAQAPRAGFELGLNEREGTPDSHGATSHLTVWELACLERYVLSIE